VIGTVFVALNLWARSKARAALQLEKHPSPHLLEFVIRKKKKSLVQGDRGSARADQSKEPSWEGKASTSEIRTPDA
jgi:hypothetical protein